MSKGLNDLGEEMLAREMDLGEYIPCNAALYPQFLALILRHAQIQWSNWIAAQWGKTSEVPFPNLAGLWTAIENQEPWKPTFPAGYTLPPENTYGGSGSGCPSPEPAYPAVGPSVDTLTEPMSVAVVAAPASTVREEAARRSSGTCSSGVGASGGGGSWGRGGGGVGGGGRGNEERLNATTYNNTYVNGRLSFFRHAGAMRLVTRKASLAGVDLPA